MKIILLLLFVSNSYSLEFLHLTPRLKPGEKLLTISTGLHSEEKTYEKDFTTIDSAKQDGNLQSVTFKSALNKNISYGVEIEGLIDGTYEESYSGSLDFIQDKHVPSKGIKEPVFQFYYWFDSELTFFNHAFFSSFRPKLIEPKAHEFYAGRNEFKLSYLYRFRRNYYEVSGEIFSMVYGKKEVRLDTGAEDEIESFTEVGVKFTPGLIFENVSIHLLSSYSSTTDYNTKNQHFERNSDKGYAVEIGGKINWTFSNGQGISFSYLERESYYNSIEEDKTRVVEYEIDSEEYLLSWWIIL